MSIFLDAAFDGEISIQDLLKGLDQKKLYTSLRHLLGTSVTLISNQDEVVLGASTVDHKRRPLTLCGEIEPIASLCAAQPETAQLDACACLLELLLCNAKQYYMVSALHIEAVHDDYQCLLKKHNALVESETRYKALAENLEMRVAEQVETIENSQRQLYQAEKMASVGQLAAGVAHEINNPVGFITSNLTTAQSYLKKLLSFAQTLNAATQYPELQTAWAEADLSFVVQDFDALLRECLDGAERIARIVADLKGFSNVDQPQEALADVNDCIRQACNIAASSLKGHATITLELGILPPLLCHPGHVSQVCLNMLLNAGNAMTSQGEIKIQTSVQGQEIKICISDNGSGIEESVLPRIFDPFFTTREVGQGTGLGLSVSHDIVRTHGGRIEVASKRGVGTTFTIFLPIGK